MVVQVVLGNIEANLRAEDLLLDLFQFFGGQVFLKVPVVLAALEAAHGGAH